jgi:hypothetical protein
VGISENREKKTIFGPLCPQILILCPFWNQVAAKVAWYGVIFNFVANLSSSGG